jgi:hypothetical protein
MECLNEKNLSLSALSGIVTDGAPSMVGKNKGFLALIQNKLLESKMGKWTLKICMSFTA